MPIAYQTRLLDCNTHLMMALYPLPANLKFVFFYNAVAATMWFCCLTRLLLLLPLVGRHFLPGGIADFFHVVSLIPIVSFFLVKTLLKNGFKKTDLWNLGNGIKMAWICYGVIFLHPKIAKHTSYSILIFAWCWVNLIHFAYHAFRIKTRGSPRFLFWLQYHNFYVTFPLSLVAEMILIFLSLGFVDDSSAYDLFIKVVLLSYVPVAYFNWGYLNERKARKYDAFLKKRGRSSLSSTTVSVTEGTASATTINVENVELRDMKSTS